MSASVNLVFLVGYLGKDPELRYTQGGTAVASFSLATNETWSDAKGDRQERTEWHQVVAWGKTGEICAQYLKKGSQVHIEGRIQTRKWDDKQGKTRSTTEIVAQRVTFIGGRGNASPNPPRNDSPSGQSATSSAGATSGRSSWRDRQ